MFSRIISMAWRLTAPVCSRFYCEARRVDRGRPVKAFPTCIGDRRSGLPAVHPRAPSICTAAVLGTGGCVAAPITKGTSRRLSARG